MSRDRSVLVIIYSRLFDARSVALRLARHCVRRRTQADPYTRISPSWHHSLASRLSKHTHSYSSRLLAFARRSEEAFSSTLGHTTRLFTISTLATILEELSPLQGVLYGSHHRIARVLRQVAQSFHEACCLRQCVSRTTLDLELLRYRCRVDMKLSDRHCLVLVVVVRTHLSLHACSPLLLHSQLLPVHGQPTLLFKTQCLAVAPVEFGLYPLLVDAVSRHEFGMSRAAMRAYGEVDAVPSTNEAEDAHLRMGTPRLIVTVLPTIITVERRRGRWEWASTHRTLPRSTARAILAPKLARSPRVAVASPLDEQAATTTALACTAHPGALQATEWDVATRSPRSLVDDSGCNAARVVAESAAPARRRYQPRRRRYQPRRRRWALLP